MKMAYRISDTAKHRSRGVLRVKALMLLFAQISFGFGYYSGTWITGAHLLRHITGNL